MITEISQRIAADAEGDNAKRFDGALVVKDGNEFAVIIVELKFDKTYVMLDCEASSGSMYQFSLATLLAARRKPTSKSLMVAMLRDVRSIWKTNIKSL